MVLIAIGAALFAVGLFGKLVGVDAAIILAGPGMILFVLGAWRAGHPEQGGDVGKSDINPWSI
jgi:hypothetical protein